VLSAIQSSSGRSAVHAPGPRAGAGVDAGSRRVVWSHLRRWQPASPARRMSRATRLWPHAISWAASCACTRKAPYVPRLAWWIGTMCALSWALAQARADGSPRRHAQEPLGETPSTRHLRRTGCWAPHFARPFADFRDFALGRRPSYRRPYAEHRGLLPIRREQALL